MARKRTLPLNARVPAKLMELIKKLVQNGLYPNVSEFARDALREKLARDAPELYRQLFGDVTE